MKVYVLEVSGGMYSDAYHYVEGVYATKALAKKAADEKIKSYSEDGMYANDGEWSDWQGDDRIHSGYDSHTYSVVEYEVQMSDLESGGPWYAA